MRLIYVTCNLSVYIVHVLIYHTFMSNTWSILLRNIRWKIIITRWIMTPRPNTWWNLGTSDYAEFFRVRMVNDSLWLASSIGYSKKEHIFTRPRLYCSDKAGQTEDACWLQLFCINRTCLYIVLRYKDKAWLYYAKRHNVINSITLKK